MTEIFYSSSAYQEITNDVEIIIEEAPEEVFSPIVVKDTSTNPHPESTRTLPTWVTDGL